MSAADFMKQVEEWQRQQAAVLAERRQRLAGLRCEIPEDLYDPEDGRPRYPWVWFRDQLVVLRPTGDASLPNRFGGSAEPSWRGLAKGCQPHLLLNLSPQTLGLGLPVAGPVGEHLPLCYPFRSSREPELLYRREPDGTLVATKSPKSHSSDRQWPYPDYPATLPARGLTVDGPYPVPFLALFPNGGNRTLSVQELPEDGDQFLIVMVTAREATLGVSLLGADAEAEGVQCVFLINPPTGAIWAYNQCL